MYVEVGALTHPAQGFHPPLALTRGRAQVKTLSIKNQKQRPGPSRSWWASHSLSPNGHRPWLPGPCVFGVRVLWGPLGPMVRGRALALGRACLLPPRDFGCQPRSHLCIPMVPTGGMGNLRLGEVPLPWDQGPGGWEGWKGMTKACLWTPHTKPSPSTCGPTEDG